MSITNGVDQAVMLTIAMNALKEAVINVIFVWILAAKVATKIITIVIK